MIKRIIVLVALASMTINCQSTNPQFVKEGTDYADIGIFHGRWWNYYQRGVKKMSGGFYMAASEDLRKALQGRTRDTWRARTYGLHFVEYFPNRELAVALRHLGEIDEAETLLARSLDHIDTARGHYYLDLVKRDQIARGTVTDGSAPTLEVGMQDRQLVADLDFDLPISAQDDTGVYQMKVNGEELYQRGSGKERKYRSTMTFDEGTHEVTIEAADLAGKTTTVTREVIVDLTGPNIGIGEPENALVTESATIRLEGATVDLNGVRELSLDGRIIASSDSGQDRISFDETLTLEDGSNEFVLIATDMAGNKTYALIEVFRGDPDALSAKLWRLDQLHPKYLQLAAADTAVLPILLDSLSAMDEEATGPKVVIRLPKEQDPWRNTRAVLVSGTVNSDTTITRVSINDRSMAPLAGKEREFFNIRIPLKEEELDGPIVVSVLAEDSSGKTDEDTKTIRVVPLEFDTEASKTTMAVLQFSGVIELESLLSDLWNTTQSELAQTNRFRLLERAQIDKILSEQQMSDEIGDQDSRLELGKFLPAHNFLLGNVVQRGEQAELQVRIVSTESGKIVKAVDAHIDDVRDIAKLKKGCRDVSQQIKDVFPRIQGVITRIKNDDIWFSWNKEDKVLEGMRVLILEEREDKDEATGEVWGMEVVSIGEAIIRGVTSTSTKAVRIQREGESDLDPGMPTTTM